MLGPPSVLLGEGFYCCRQLEFSWMQYPRHLWRTEGGEKEGCHAPFLVCGGEEGVWRRGLGDSFERPMLVNCASGRKRLGLHNENTHIPARPQLYDD